MRAFAEAYPHFTIVQPLVAQIPWAHHLILLNKVKLPAERLFYMQKTAETGWRKAVLSAQIASNLHLRQGAAITNFKAMLPKPQSDLARETFKTLPLRLSRRWKRDAGAGAGKNVG